MNKMFLLLLVIISSGLSSVEKINLYELYKELHANPELSYQEIETSNKLANILRNIGYEVTQNVGGNGVVALLKNGVGKTTVSYTHLRAHET